jgi:hypothetical protein
MWSRIAEEMAIPWRAAEAMHWQMGEHEMARRAGVTPFSLTTNTSANGLHGSNSFLGTRTHHIRSASATPRLRRDSTPQMVQIPQQMPPQLPSLAELTAGLPAYSPHGQSSHGIGRPYQGALTPPHLYHHPSSHAHNSSQNQRLGHDFGPPKFFQSHAPGSEPR